MDFTHSNGGWLDPICGLSPPFLYSLHLVLNLSSTQTMNALLQSIKVHPNVPPIPSTTHTSPALHRDVLVLTVWKKSLLFNCYGFTVFDANGNLVFRVDNYMAASGTASEIVLMDAAGKPLLTIRRKRLCLADTWLLYEGETTVNPRFSVRKHVNILNTKCLAHVSPAAGKAVNAMYEVEGSYAQRRCVVYDERKRRVAEIKQKEPVGGVTFGVDVFHLIVGPDLDASVAMAIVILLDQMFGSSKRLST